MFAVIQTGGKQYRVKANDILTIEKIPQAVGETVEFNNVLLLADEAGAKVTVGKPVIAGSKVAAKVLEQGRALKISVVKFKSKVRYKRKVGHRQPFTRVQVLEIRAP